MKSLLEVEAGVGAQDSKEEEIIVEWLEPAASSTTSVDF